MPHVWLKMECEHQLHGKRGTRERLGGVNALSVEPAGLIESTFITLWYNPELNLCYLVGVIASPEFFRNGGGRKPEDIKKQRLT